MAGFIPTILQPLDALRSIAGVLGLRPYTVKVRVRVWSGERPGLGSRTDIDTTLYNTINGVQYPVRVRTRSQRDVIESGGQFSDHDFLIGPMTPQYIAPQTGLPGGYLIGQLDPAPTNSATELVWFMSGPDLPANAAFSKIGTEGTALHFTVILRQSGKRTGLT